MEAFLDCQSRPAATKIPGRRAIGAQDRAHAVSGWRWLNTRREMEADGNGRFALNLAPALGRKLVFSFVLLVMAFKWRDFLLHAFDPAQAMAAGLPVRLLHYGLLCILSLTIVSALKAVGIILTIALLIAPGAIAFLLTKRFERMLLISVAVAALSSLTGVYSSFFIDSAPAPTIVLLMTLIFIIAFFAAIRRNAKASSSINL